MSKTLKRCPWPAEDSRMIEYHDREWGVPLHDDRGLFEFLVLEGMQAGLSWSTILNKPVSQLAAIHLHGRFRTSHTVRAAHSGTVFVFVRPTHQAGTAYPRTTLDPTCH